MTSFVRAGDRFTTSRDDTAASTASRAAFVDDREPSL